MSQEAKTDWKAGDVPTADDFNRIEGNIADVKAAQDDHVAAEMPHKTADGGYRWGLRINPDLSATLIFEEV